MKRTDDLDTPLPWDTPGLEPRLHSARCARHYNLCAYRDDDPAYCPRCHRSYGAPGGCPDCLGHLGKPPYPDPPPPKPRKPKRLLPGKVKEVSW